MLAPAKLNLALHVTGQRQDGYHTLESLVAFASVGDEVTIALAPKDHLMVDGPFADNVPPLRENTLGDALSMVRRWGDAPEPVHIYLTKNVPIASGIGGGSADAAALICLLTGGRALTAQEMADCLALGADVPMCVIGKPAIVGGIGEDNTPVELPQAHVVLVNPGVGVATPAIFKALQNKSNPSMPRHAELRSFEDLVAYLQQCRNDLGPAAQQLAPEISTCLAALNEAPFARMSGSGATCFSLLKTAGEAEKLAAKTQNAHPNWWVRVGNFRPKSV
ncbi:MAG: 4-(cytidine 5'-diphospho)-2-C-methyl-D-erythritol kinase [Devosiaceae bacterium]